MGGRQAVDYLELSCLPLARQIHLGMWWECESQPATTERGEKGKRKKHGTTAEMPIFHVFNQILVFSKVFFRNFFFLVVYVEY